MIGHFFLIAYRSLMRNKSSSLINLIGLSTGLACALMINLWVQDELNINRFDIKDGRRYQVFTNHQFDTGIQTAEATTGMLVQTLPDVIPEIEYAACYHHFGSKIPLSADDIRIRAKGVFASKDFFNVFNFPLLTEKADKVLSASDNIAISEELAIRLFGQADNLMGKAITVASNQIFYVSGVYRIPANTQLNFDFMLSFDDLAKKFPQSFSNWGNTGPRTFLLLKEQANVKPVSERLKTYLNDQGMIGNAELLMQPFTETYLHNNYVNGVPQGGRIMYVKLFSVIAFFIVAIACINFMNLSTAQASKRIKEVGIKKVIGSSSRELIIQYMAESLVMVLLSTVLAIMIVQLLLPEFNQITQKDLLLTIDLKRFLTLLSVILFVALLAGSYPALYLSGFNPAAILKGSLHSAGGEAWTRKGLVTFQFCISVILIASTIVVYKQIEFIRSQQTGFDKEQVVYFNADGTLAENKDAFISELKNIPGVVNATSTDHSLIGQQHQTSIEWEGKKANENISFEYIQVNYDMLETLGLEMKEGRSFSRSFGDEATKIIFNEAAITSMGIRNPIGRKVVQFGVPKEIIGVVKDFHFESFHQSVKPLFISFNPGASFLIMTRIEAGNKLRTLKAIEDLHKKFNSDFSLDYAFLNDDYGAQYAAEERIGILSRYFGGLAILISCVGLFGLSAFTAERRLKEISIRKILGADNTHIILLLSGGFTKNVIISITIALPVAYALARNWLNDYAYRIELNPWYFATAGIAVLIITWVTISIQTFKAARSNPTQSLKNE